MRRLRATHGRLAMFGMIALLAAAGGGAYAATTASGNRSGVIVACVHRNGGGLYVAKRCAKRDSRLTWDVRGLRGLTGLPGPKDVMSGSLF